MPEPIGLSLLVLLEDALQATQGQRFKSDWAKLDVIVLRVCTTGDVEKGA